MLVVELATAEGDAFARGRICRDHEPAAVKIVVAALARFNEIGYLGDREIDAARLEFGDEGAPRIGVVAEFERIDRLRA